MQYALIDFEAASCLTPACEMKAIAIHLLGCCGHYLSAQATSRS